jgi:hypothetical protein
MDKTPETVAFDISRLEVGKEIIVSTAQFRSIVKPEVFAKNIRNAESYTDNALRSLALALNETNGNSEPIRIAKVGEEMRVTAGNRRSAVMLHGTFNFSEGSKDTKKEIEVSPHLFNVKLVFIGVMSEKEYLQAVSDQLLQKGLNKAEKFEVIRRFAELSYNEASIKRITDLKAGVVQPALRCLKVAMAVKNAKYRLADAMKNKDEKMKAMAEIADIDKTIIDDYKEGRITADSINELSVILNSAAKHEEKERILLEKYSAPKAGKQAYRSWQDIKKDILPHVHARYQTFANAIMTLGEIDLTKFKE